MSTSTHTSHPLAHTAGKSLKWAAIPSVEQDSGSIHPGFQAVR
jgi:hypothetical protein